MTVTFPPLAAAFILFYLLSEFLLINHKQKYFFKLFMFIFLFIKTVFPVIRTQAFCILREQFIYKIMATRYHLNCLYPTKNETQL